MKYLSNHFFSLKMLGEKKLSIIIWVLWIIHDKDFSFFQDSYTQELLQWKILNAPSCWKFSKDSTQNKPVTMLKRDTHWVKEREEELEHSSSFRLKTLHSTIGGFERKKKTGPELLTTIGFRDRIVKEFRMRELLKFICKFMSILFLLLFTLGS